MEAVDSTKPEDPPVEKEAQDASAVADEGSGWIDYLYNNTSQFASMLQWGESSEPYSLSKDYATVMQTHEALQKKREQQGSHSLDINTFVGTADPVFCNTNSSSKVADTTLYDRLNVPTDAKKSAIKTSYYKLALKYHPDKNPNDEEAKKKFQEISEAYQVLSDDAMRAKYDKYGSKATQDMPLLDPSLFFMLLFGCEGLEDYIGTLKIASFLRFATDASADKKVNINSQMDIEQSVREVVLAKKLCERIDGIIKQKQLPKELKKDLEELCNGTFGDTLVESIGWIYENSADSFIAEATTFWGLGATLPNIQAAGRSLNNTWSMAKSVVNVALVVKDLKASSSGEFETPDSTIETMDKLKDIITNTLSLVLYDVEATVRVAATKVCQDEDVSPKHRLNRAHALRDLGILMQRVAQTSRKKKPDEPPDISKQMYNAFTKAVHRQEGSEEHS
ncbi:bifunctional DnaJ domain/DNAJ-containing protein [Babesia duncani]|uniref:Bifunctional DnaJ domain/DNAJ-containing protein n=1 Tax=Babesia duncani TaxID=323732 RepID=A0AAD9PJL4_9APIC|nr:bifunctional DnaJ domain/DNAJ-containing protein [Babesia duncani]